jgi:hypothetical protein
LATKNPELLDGASANALATNVIAVALQGVIDYINPLIEANPDAKWQAHCPTDTILDGSYDDAWLEGQSNGEVHAARRIQSILNKALGTE